MHRLSKPKSPIAQPENKSKKSIRKNNPDIVKQKGSEEQEREIAKLAEQKAPERETKEVKDVKPPPPPAPTLQGIGNELFNVKPENKSKHSKEKEDAVGEKDKFKQPPKIQKADAKDPQYETLADIQKADAKDPQYETLADVKDDIFKRQ
ncbi:unnamed protein product [Strongylus vulgaris]|uniref:Uncharacterized protein n=1 Tax=Strongylus vulgaris TaxID=40348 RepID=A0A3P7JKV9_STRVU|nr:unnamed protein product [Strongylus vulgaris]